YCCETANDFAMTCLLSLFASQQATLRFFALTLIVTSGVWPFFEMLPETVCVEIPPRMSAGFALHVVATWSTIDSAWAIWRTVLGLVCAAWSWTLPLAEYG